MGQHGRVGAGDRETTAGEGAGPSQAHAHGGVAELQRAIGNRAVGSLLRRRLLAREVSGKPQEAR